MGYEDDRPEGERPDLSWASTRAMVLALYARRREQGWVEDTCTLAKYTPSVVPWWQGGKPRFEHLEVAGYWVMEELKERRVRDHAACLAQMKRASTRHLLSEWLHIARIVGWYSPAYDSEPSYGVSYEDIKNELATREHIPNKVEAKALRRAAATQHRKNKLRGPVAQRLRAVAL